VNERVFITGGSGFVGEAVIDELLSRGCTVNALVNRKRIVDHPAVNVFAGGIFDQAVVRKAMTGCTAAIHLIGIIKEIPSKGVTFQRMHAESTRAVLAAAQELGVRRYVHMSALGTRPDAVSEYHRTKYEAEQAVRATDLAWTILRPSMIHGRSGEFMRMEAKWVRKKSPPFLFMPYFGRGITGFGGAGMLQPVYVKDVAKAFVDCLENPKTIRKAYCVAGSERVSWPGLHHIAARAIANKNRWTLAIPAWYATMLTHIVPGRLLPFNRAQVIMSQEDNTCDMTPFIQDFGWEPGSFSATLQQYASHL
jgi:NADH dehydrogenase